MPILATDRMRQAYGYIDDDRVVVTRPAAMREVFAIKALRTGDPSFFLESDPLGNGHKMSEIRGLDTAVKDMVSAGWRRTNDAVNQFKEKLWARNEAVIGRLLRDT